VPGHRAESAAQARSDHRAVPARGTIVFVPGRSSAGLFRAVSELAHLAWPIWTSIAVGMARSQGELPKDYGRMQGQVPRIPTIVVVPSIAKRFSSDGKH
jgi:hypothetical protein